MPSPNPPSDPPGERALAGYEIVVCVTGGIAAYKTAALVSRLMQQGGGVTVAMTRHARRFVGPVTFRALTGRDVLTSLWAPRGAGPYVHLDPGEAADLVIVAPATANILGKLAGGMADDLVSTLLLGAACPVLLAPAMNERMWRHPAVQRNVATLKEWGMHQVGPESGWLACGVTGAGRMAEPDAIYDAACALLQHSPPKSRSAR